MITATEDRTAHEFLGRLAEAHQAAERAPSGSGPHGGRLRMSKQSRIQATYDAAQTTELNKKYWARADLKSADAANSPEVRRDLRSRARYEAFEANSFAKRIVYTLANDLIGSGPRLQMQLPDKEANSRIERIVNGHFRRIHLARKLRTMKLARTVSGEGCAHFITNSRLSGVQLDLALFECDQLHTPFLMFQNKNTVDGIRFDDDGNPVEYHKLKSHPGADHPFVNVTDFDPLPASEVIHTFRHDRPGQHRGIPEITTALPLFALLRDYTLAVLHNARTAAKFTGVMETDTGAFSDDGDKFDSSVDPFDFVDIDYDMLTSLPFGWKLKQFQPAQPISTFQEFRNAIINEIAACVLMPLNVSVGDSSDYNYASGRLDHQTYFKAIDVERSEWGIEVLDPILFKVLEEAMFVRGSDGRPLLPETLGPLEALPYEWHWDGHPHVDPQKESQGQKIRLQSGVTHRAREYARQGEDIDDEDRRAAESYGVSVEVYRQRLLDAHFPPTSGATGSAEEDGDSEDSENRDQGGNGESNQKAAAAAEA